MMKTNKFLTMAVLASGFAMSFTSCSTEDNPATPDAPKSAVISFEEKTLGADGFWCGDETGVKFENWGADAYACSYAESGVTFPINYTPAWASWSGYAISNRTETTFNSSTMTPDQFNNITGTAHSGKNFCVVNTYGETIDLAKECTIKGFYYTNNAWSVYAILNGDGMTPGKFEATDWFKCIVTGTKADGTTANVEINLAKDGDYVKDWQYADLTSLGKVVSISFAFEGTKSNEYGLTTPAYICIDDIEVEF